MQRELTQLVLGRASTEDVLTQVQQQYAQSLQHKRAQSQPSAAEPPVNSERPVLQRAASREKEELAAPSCADDVSLAASDAAPCIEETQPKAAASSRMKDGPGTEVAVYGERAAQGPVVAAPAAGSDSNCERMVRWCQQNIVVYKYWAERYHWRHLAFTALHVLLNAVLAAIPTMEKLFPWDHYRYAAFAFGSLNTLMLGLPWVKECREKYSSYEEYQEALLDFVNQVNADPNRSFAKYRDDFLTRAKGPPLTQEQIRAGLAYFETWGRLSNLALPAFDSTDTLSIAAI